MSDQLVPKSDIERVDYPPFPMARRVSPVVIDNPANAETSFVEIWRVVRKRKWLIAGSAFGAFALALAYSLLITPKYMATSTIEFNRENSDVLGVDDSRAMLGEASAMDYVVTQQTQVDALQSDTLALQVVHELNLESRPEFTRQSISDHFRSYADESSLPLEKASHRRATVLKAYHRNLRVEQVPGTRMIKVRFLNPDPQLSAAIVNTLVGDYQEQYFKTRFSATMEASDWLSKQLDELKKQVETSQEKLVRYQKEAGILGTDEAHNIVMTRLEELDKQLVSAQANRILAQTVWQLTKTGNPELISGLVGSSAAGTSSAMPNSLALIENLRSQQSQLKVEYARAATKYGSDYPKLIQLRSELQAIDDATRTEVGNLASRAQNDYMTAQQTEDAMRASFERAKIDANKMNDSAVQYSLLKHEVESSRGLYDGLLKQLKEAGVLAGLRSTNVVTVDAARPSDRPAKPYMLLNLAAGLLGGLFLGVVGAFAVDNLDETITTPDQAEQVSSLPSLGFVPRWKALAGADKATLAGGSLAEPVLVVSRPQSQIAEAFRTLRTSIIQMTRSNQHNVLLVTSALPEEGKTTTSLNTAAALAQQGASVLLVDADMRRSKLSSRLNLDSPDGLGSMINGEADGLPVKLPSVPGLSVVPAGPKSAYPAELLGSHRMAELIQRWRAEYDYVVIDSPPILSVTDAVVLSPYCDAVVLVVRSGVTRKQSLLRVRDLFSRSQVKIAGIVTNAFDLKSVDHYHYFGFESTAKSRRGYYTPERN